MRIKDKHIGDVARIETFKILDKNQKAIELYNSLEEDRYIQGLIEHGNTLAIKRLRYNDHGIVHSRISVHNALTILHLLRDAGMFPNIVSEHTGTYEDAQIVVALATYLHDIGNSIHRVYHYQHGLILVEHKLDYYLKNFYPDMKKMAKIKASILECIYSHDESVISTSLESGCVKVGDGADMANGRARIPFSRGKLDIHSLSALAINRVEILKGEKKPVMIRVYMTNDAGIFQVQHVLGGKINTSGIEDYIEIYGIKDNEVIGIEI